MIPEEKKEAVARGLREAFGVGESEDIAKVTGGHTSSLVFRIIVEGSPYLLKIITRADDPSRHYANMEAAAEAGVAPPVRYTNVADKVSITDFVVAEPLPASEALARMPAVLRTLHAVPAFDKAPFNTTCTFLLNKGPALEGFLKQFQAADILPAAAKEELFARYAEVAAVCPHDDREMVSSHNDLFKPDNILFDGRSVWLVDWEASFLNDRYADLAVVANQVVSDDGEEVAFLAAYFGASPDDYQRARFHLMQQIAHMFYTMAFLHLGAAEKPIDWSERAPDFRDFLRRMWAGEVDLADNDVKIAYGKAHWDQLQQNVQQDRYREALRVVADRHAEG